ncbi:MAG: DUF1638 domain-containing protein [Acidimicrobiia bacterium]|nr:DUF1638 domain-containing protein [Acidimicrobiia bacterium]
MAEGKLDRDLRSSRTPAVLILACGALARELLAVSTANNLLNVTVECLPGEYHMRPEKIVPALEARLAAHLSDDGHDGQSRYDTIFIGYGDCGTGGALDRFCAAHGLHRLPGDHCYQFFAGQERFLRLHDAEPGTFYLTDYLAKHFDRFVVEALGIDSHPELAELYFGNYTRLVYLCQVADPAVEAKARDAARFLGLDFELVITGYGDLETSVVEVAMGRPTVATEEPA